MSWILIVVTVMSSSMTGDSVSIATAEFSDQYSCQQAAKRTEQLVGEAAAARPTKAVRWDCMPKGAPVR